MFMAVFFFLYPILDTPTHKHTLQGDSDNILAIYREEQQLQVPIFTVVPGTVR